MVDARHRLAQWGWTLAFVLAACQQTPEETRDAAAFDPVDYVPAPADGGACPLPEDISFIVTEGVDAFLVVSVTLHAPATITQGTGLPSNYTQCSYPAPACGDPSVPDFADVRALLAEPEVIALREQGHVSFGLPFGINRVARTLTFGGSGGAESIAVYDEPPTCSTPAQDAGAMDCVPDVVAQLFNLVESFKTLHACD